MYFPQGEDTGHFHDDPGRRYLNSVFYSCGLAQVCGVGFAGAGLCDDTDIQNLPVSKILNQVFLDPKRLGAQSFLNDIKLSCEALVGIFNIKRPVTNTSVETDSTQFVLTQDHRGNATPLA